MPAKRIIPIQLLLGGKLVKTRKFTDHRYVGNPAKSCAVYNSAHADEILFLNISRDDRTIAPLRETIEAVSRASFIPISVGGGITSASDVAELIRAGADRVVVNSVAYRNLGVITAIASTFGAQAVVASIDVRGDKLYSNCGRQIEPVSLADHVHRCIDAGAGEIMIQSIDRDGTMQGYDIDLIRMVVEIASVPVIAAGGSGNYDHLREVFETGAGAVACGSLFNFSDSNPLRAKSYLASHFEFR